MGVRTATVLSACLLALKGCVCQTINTSSVAVSGSGLSQQGLQATNAITVPAIITPMVQPFDCNSLTQTQQAPSVPNYGSFMPAPSPMPMPPIIIDGGSSGGGSNSLLSLLFLMFILNNKKGGNGGGCGNNGCGYRGGYGGRGCGGGYGGGYGGNYGVPDYYDAGYYEAVGYVGNNGGYGNTNPGEVVSSYGGSGSNYPGAGNVAEIAITEGYYVGETSPPNPYQYQTIQPYPGREPNEICLIVKTDYPPS